MKTYYKVCNTSRNDILTSAVCNYFAPVEYKINQAVVAPEDTKLFVFNNLTAAKKFVYSQIANITYLRLKIFECTITNPRKPIDAWNATSRLKFWKDIKIARKKKVNILRYLIKNGSYADPWPAGTIWCDSVTLTKQVSI